MLKQGGGGGGGYQPAKIVRRSLAIGDVIASTIVADKLIESGFSVIFQSHASIHPILRRHPAIGMVDIPANPCHANLDRAYEQHPLRTRRHFYGFFMDAARTQLRGIGVELGPAINCRPRLNPHRTAQQALASTLKEYPRPWVFICPRSENYKPRQVPDGIWAEAAKKIKGTKFWTGLFPAPPGIVDLGCRNLAMLLDYLSLADLLVTVDTGPMHMANAVGTQILAIGQSSSPELHLSDQTDFRTIQPNLDCLNCQKNICPISEWMPPCQNIDPDLIAEESNRSLRTLEETVSAVIPIFKPSAEMLNRCLEAVLPQVSEVIVTRERGGILPAGVSTDPKIRHVVKQADEIGFGRNVNFGVRHSTGKYVLVLNDDVYLAPDAVGHLMACMGERVGIVGQRLHYPDGRIYHAGKVRQPGRGIGFPHIDWGKTEHTIRRPIEMENTNGASILFRRKAFYDADGYDEGYRFYAEDDDICMKVRRAGWQLWYTPLASGIHDEHQETRKITGINSIMAQSNARFGQKWSEYFRHNAKNTGVGDFSYTKGKTG